MAEMTTPEQNSGEEGLHLLQLQQNKQQTLTEESSGYFTPPATATPAASITAHLGKHSVACAPTAATKQQKEQRSSLSLPITNSKPPAASRRYSANPNDLSTYTSVTPLSPATSPSRRRISLSTDKFLPPLQIHKRLSTPTQTPIIIGGPRAAPLRIARKDSKVDNSDDVALMLARAEVANDLLFKDPKRVVIEHGHLHTDEGTLRLLIDVSTPPAAKQLQALVPLQTPAPLVASEFASELAEYTASALSSVSAVDVDEDADSDYSPKQSTDSETTATMADSSTGKAGSAESKGDKEGGHGLSKAPLTVNTQQAVESRNSGSGNSSCRPDSYKVYPEGDDRALPAFILNSQTIEELDAVTSAWEAALDTLGDGGFWRSVVNDVDGLKKRAPLHLSAKIRAGIPAAVRGVVWQTLTQARSTYLQTVYTQLIQEYSPHERIIRRDLTRTFPRIPVFKGEGGEGQQRLFRILKAYSLYDAEVGYCQGLGFIIGPLIMSMGECEAFCVLVRLMETYDLRGMFTEDMAGLHLRLFQFQILAAEIVPDVMAHLERYGVVAAMYVPSWFLSLFAYTMPLGFVLRAMDVIMTEGAPESIMRIGIALLQRNADKILRQDDFESAMGVLNGGLYDDENNSRDRPGFVLQEAAKLSAVVTQQRLEELEARYCSEQGIVPRTGRPSMSSPTAAAGADAAEATTNHAIMKFLGWPWTKDSAGSGASSAPPPPQVTSAQPKWRVSSLGRGLGAGSDSDDDAANADELIAHLYHQQQQRTGRISPRILELTESQRAHSHQLREQMLKSLQAQDNAPATMLGMVSSLAAQSQNQQNQYGEVKSRISVADSLASDNSSGGDSGLHNCRSPSSAVPRGGLGGEPSDSAWRDEVLEPLQRQLHDARVTCDTHRDALVALQADHESLRAELAMAKTQRAGLAEDNEQLRMALRRAEADRTKSQQESEHNLERAQRSEGVLIQARMDLAEADEEKHLLVRQLNNLRKFIAAESAGSTSEGAQLSPIQEDGVLSRTRMVSMDEYPQANISSPPLGAKPSRFSISSIASNWSAIRGAIASPRPSMQQDAPGNDSSADSAAPFSAPLTVSTQQGGVIRTHSALSPPVLSPALSAGSLNGSSKPSAIPLAMLHRSKTSPPMTMMTSPTEDDDSSSSSK
ncbi:hypothetical protein LPJ66_000181 [Kickxella alabastrina]|uniref:Uncharacterized protein n=1 Tax=Kickxella alabastrina TaxID=61397 RepID=A0ACC1IWS9_9FUNG|nr:hypothetical protein LPJ66_000181 [Kickxella alabastrina]